MQEIKDFRAHLDEGLKLIDQYKFNNSASRAVAMASSSLERARQWAGQVLNEMGTQSPYQKNYESASDIAPMADLSDEDFHRNPTWTQKNSLEKIQYLRSFLSTLKDYWRAQLNPHVLERHLADRSTDVWKSAFLQETWVSVWRHMTEANMSLGMELGRMRDEYVANDIVQKERDEYIATLNKSKESPAAVSGEKEDIAGKDSTQPTDPESLSQQKPVGDSQGSWDPNNPGLYGEVTQVEFKESNYAKSQVFSKPLAPDEAYQEETPVANPTEIPQENQEVSLPTLDESTDEVLTEAQDSDSNEAEGEKADDTIPQESTGEELANAIHGEEYPITSDAPLHTNPNESHKKTAEQTADESSNDTWEDSQSGESDDAEQDPLDQTVELTDEEFDQIVGKKEDSVPQEEKDVKDTSSKKTKSKRKK